MSAQSYVKRTWSPSSRALLMSSVAVGAAVGPAQVIAAPQVVPMPDLEILEAQVPVRTPRMPGASRSRRRRFAPLAQPVRGADLHPHARHFAANMTELLDRSEDPARMIRMIILEMEETLVEVRATAARSIADIKEMRRAVSRLDDLQIDWGDKAELALEKGREDLACAALAERQKAAEMAEGLYAEMAQIEVVLKGYEADIQRLQAKLPKRARARTRSPRGSKAPWPRRPRSVHGPHPGGVREVRGAGTPADFAEGRADALGRRSLEDRFPSCERPKRSTPNSKR